MNAWDFLSSLDSTTLIVVLVIALVAVLAIGVGAVAITYRVTWFIIEFARLPKVQQRGAVGLMKHAPKLLGR